MKKVTNINKKVTELTLEVITQKFGKPNERVEENLKAMIAITLAIKDKYNKAILDKIIKDIEKEYKNNVIVSEVLEITEMTIKPLYDIMEL